MEIELDNRANFACDESAICSIAHFALTAMGIHPESELSITLVDESEMSELHVKWMDLPGPTDVLSFPMDQMRPHSIDEGPGLVGDIVLCPPFAAKQAKDGDVNGELALLTTHGVLHLLGFDHAEKEEERVMFELQSKILIDWKEGA